MAARCRLTVAEDVLWVHTEAEVAHLHTAEALAQVGSVAGAATCQRRAEAEATAAEVAALTHTDNPKRSFSARKTRRSVRWAAFSFNGFLPR